MNNETMLKLIRHLCVFAFIGLLIFLIVDVLDVEPESPTMAIAQAPAITPTPSPTPIPTPTPTPTPNAPIFDTIYFENALFTGYHLDGQLISGILIWSSPADWDGCWFEGEWLNTPDGRVRRGRYECIRGNVFIGDTRIVNDIELHRTASQIYGTFTWSNGATFYGQWFAEHGYRLGTHTSANGTIRTGRFSIETGEFLD